MAIEEKEPEEEVAARSGGMSTMKIVIAAVLVSSILSGAIVGVTLYLMSDDNTEQSAQTPDDTEADAAEEEEAEEPTEVAQPTGPASYMRLDPNFVVSFSDQRLARFMQFSLQIVTRDKKLEEYVKLHMPAIRSNLFLLLNNQSAERMMTREGKQELLIMIADDINQSLENLAGTSGVEAAYFDTFIIQ